MKPFKEVINYHIGNSFIIRHNDFEHFSVPYHYHGEYELVYIISSTGKKFVGDVIEDFGPRDLVFLGSTLPHFYLNDKQYYTGNPELRVKAYILQFPANYFSDDQLSRPEFAPIYRLLANSSRGLKFPESIKDKVASLLEKMYQENGLVRYFTLIELLNLLGQSDFTLIASPGYSKQSNYNFNNRLVKVYEYSIQNYNKKISLNEVASVAGMNPAAFCRYFRSKMRKTYAEFINELRINNACNLLRNSNETIAFVCFETGFNNLSNFNRQFKGIIGKSPSAYRKFLSTQSI
jgi:AraC-like DNA-binding protein